MIIRVKPAEGLVIRAPDGAVIPAAGAHLERDLYIQRRLDAGDLVVIPEDPEPTNRKKGAEA